LKNNNGEIDLERMGEADGLEKLRGNEEEEGIIFFLKKKF